GVLYCVDADWHGLDRTTTDVWPQQLQWQDERVIHQHFLACRRVELLVDQRFDQMPRQLRAPSRGWQRTQAPAFVHLVILLGRADGERGHLVEKEVEPVIVVEDDCDIGPHAAQPSVYVMVPVEKRLPVRLLLQSLGDRLAD